jgi:beta-galactosidase
VFLHNLPESPGPRLWLGTVYHPEHWPEQRWPEDVRLMTEAGLNVVWMTGCSWVKLEPDAGEFDFGWLDRAIALLAENGISTVLGPSDLTLPPWLQLQHPDLLALTSCEQSALPDDGPDPYRGASELQAAVAHLVGAMAKRFGLNPHVIGWQLADKIRLPKGLPAKGLIHDPLRLPFLSRSQLLQTQIELLRPHLRIDAWIASSPTSWQNDCDPYALAELCDLASLAFYSGSAHHDYVKTDVRQALAWGLKRRGYWVVATSQGQGEKARARNILHRDEVQALAWQAIAHGASGLAPWQFRPDPDGEGQNPVTLVDQSGQPRPYYDEIKLLGLEFDALSTYLVDSTTSRARVAILNSFESHRALEAERESIGFEYFEHLEHWHRPLIVRNVPVDIIPADANLDQYKMVIAPALSVLDEKIANGFKDFVRHSGHLVLTVRTGLRNEQHALFPLRQPGPLATLAGVEVEDSYPLDEPVPVKGNWFEGVARHWAERLRILDPNKAVKIARYGPSNGWLDNEIAITVCAQGTGLTYMVGVYLDVPAQQAMVDHFLQNAGLQKFDSPPGVQVSVRVRPNGEQIYVIVNHERAPATITLPFLAQNPLTGQVVSGAFRLASYGVAVLLKSEPSQTPTTS